MCTRKDAAGVTPGLQVSGRKIMVASTVEMLNEMAARPR